MNKLNRILLNIGLSISLLFGLWHFFIPYMFNWYSYIPDAPRSIIVSIDWINFFFSLLLFGISIILLFLQKQIVQVNTNVYSFFALLVFTWLSRIVITIIHPWNIKYQFIDIIQITIFTIVFVLLIFPFVYFLLQQEKKKWHSHCWIWLHIRFFQIAYSNFFLIHINNYDYRY